MTSDSKTNSYSFLNFQFIPSQHQLHHQGQTIQLSKKNHDLLVALVQSNGQVLAKDQLIDLIWPGQIVTDAALNKQITRLRQTLADFETAEMIETIRGVGIRFVSEVHSQELDTDHNLHRKNSSWVVVAILIIVSLVVWMLQNNKSVETTEWDQFSTINMAVIPALNNNDWLNVGSIDHLSNQLLEYTNIQAIKPDINWLKQDSAEVIGIELSQTDNIEFVLMLETHQFNGVYSADLSFRNSKKMIAKKSLQADSIRLLLEQIEVWTLQQINITSKLNIAQKQNKYQTTDFVMENYIRGLAVGQARQYAQAKRLFETASNQDPKFYPAWFALTAIELELGQFDKALALINTLAQSTASNNEIQPKIKSLQAKVYVYLNRLDEAQTLLDQSTQEAQENQDVNIIMRNLRTQVLISEQKGEFGESDLKSQKQLLELTKKYTPSPSVVAEIELNIGVIYFFGLHDVNNGTKMINSAIKNFKTTKTAAGLVVSYVNLSEMYLFQSRHGEAKLTINKALPWLDQVEGARSLLAFWKVKAKIHIENGELDAASQCLETLHQMSVTYASQLPTIEAWVLETHAALLYDRNTEASRVLDKLNNLISEDQQTYPSAQAYAILMNIFLAIKNGKIDEAKNLKKQYLDTHPQIQDWLSDGLSRMDSLILSEEGYKKQALERLNRLEQSYLDQNFIIIANYIANDMIQIHQNDDSIAIHKIINRVKNRPHFPYPFDKYQAQIWYKEGNLIQAITLMSELKAQAKDFWTPQDQLLLESWQQQNSQP